MENIQNFLVEHYLIIKSLHLISVIAWMAGLFYLPRLFVYHADLPKQSETAALFKIMERRLLRIIMNPAMIATWIFGLLLIAGSGPSIFKEGWMHLKLTAVILMTGVHHILSAKRKAFEQDQNTKSAKYYRILNEVPTVLLIIIVFAVIVKPF